MSNSSVPGLGQHLHVVVIGAGIAGISAAESIRNVSPTAGITLVSRSHELPYYRLNLTRYLAGEIEERSLTIHPESWYKSRKISLMLGVDVKAIHAGRKVVELQDKTELPFDKLLLTSGSHAFMPPFIGSTLDGVTCLRSKDDARKILSMANAGTECAIIGGGVLGLEAAGALVKRGVKVTVLEGAAWLLPRQLDKIGGEVLERHIKGLGIGVRDNCKIAGMVGDGKVSGVLLVDKTVLPAGLVIVATGVRPNINLARSAGLDVSRGILVDNFMTTSNRDILAAGDVSEHKGLVYGLWSASQVEGSIAGLNAAGQKTEFGGISRSTTLKILGLALASIGKVEPEDESWTVISRVEEGRYFRFIFRDGKMAGAILIGDTSSAVAARKAIESGQDLFRLLDRKPNAMEIAGEIKLH